MTISAQTSLYKDFTMTATKDNFKAINTHMETIGWQTQSDEVDEAIGHLSPAQIAKAESLNNLHKDFWPYLSAFHVTWLFHAGWPIPNLSGENDRPDNYDPTIPLNKVSLWAPQDYIK